MHQSGTPLTATNINLALQRLELLLEPDSRELMNALHQAPAAPLPALSRQLRKSPGRLKKQLDRLITAGLVFQPKRQPNGYSLNQLKCLKIHLRLAKLR